MGTYLPTVFSERMCLLCLHYYCFRTVDISNSQGNAVPQSFHQGLGTGNKSCTFFWPWIEPQPTHNCCPCELEEEEEAENPCLNWLVAVHLQRNWLSCICEEKCSMSSSILLSRKSWEAPQFLQIRWLATCDSNFSWALEEDIMLEEEV
jgi:hypothetical protein